VQTFGLPLLLLLLLLGRLLMAENYLYFAPFTFTRTAGPSRSTFLYKISLAININCFADRHADPFK